MGRKFGFSFSWKRATGISGLKSKIARKTGIPTTKSGRQRKVGRILSVKPIRSSSRRRKAGRAADCVLPVLLVLLIALFSAFITSAQTETPQPKATATPRIYSTETVNAEGTLVVQCLIKGNISSNKKSKIYHLPHQRDYEKTIIDTSKGEMWFCTEEEAVEAGWRAAKK